MMQSSHVFIAVNPTTQQVVFKDCDSFAFTDERFQQPDWWTAITVVEHVDEAFNDLMWLIANPPPPPGHEEEYEPYYTLGEPRALWQ